MKVKRILSLFIVLMPFLLLAQSFKINIENMPSTFTKRDAKLFPFDPSQSRMLATWTDSRLGEEQAFGQFVDRKTGQKIGPNFPLLGDNRIVFLHDSVYLATRWKDHRSNSEFVNDWFDVKGQFFNGTHRLGSDFLIMTGSYPWCGTGYTGVDYQIIPFTNSVAILQRDDSHFFITRFDLNGQKINTGPDTMLVTSEFTTASFGENGYALLFTSDPGKDQDPTFNLWYSVLNAHDSVVRPPVKIKTLAGVNEYWWWDGVPLAAVSLNDSAALAAYWLPTTQTLTYFRIYKSGKFDSLQSIPLKWNVSYYSRSFRFTRLMDGTVRLILSGVKHDEDITRWIANFVDFQPDGVFQDTTRIEASRPSFNWMVFKDNNTFYSASAKNADVYLKFFPGLELSDSLKLNDDRSGSNEHVRDILPRGKRFFVVYQDEIRNWGRVVAPDGEPTGGEVPLQFGAQAFFSDESYVQFWRHRQFPEEWVGFSIFDSRGQLQICDTLAVLKAYTAYGLAAQVLNDQTFVLAYYTYDSKNNLHVIYVNRNGDIQGTFSINYGETSPDRLRFFTLKNGNFWLTWRNCAVKFPAEAGEALTGVRSFDANIALVFDPGLFLLLDKTIWYKGHYNAALTNTAGDTLTATFPILLDSTYSAPFFLKLNEEKFLTLYETNGTLSSNVYALNGNLLIKNKIINRSDTGIVKHPMAAVNGQNVLFAWDATGLPGCGYDVHGLVLPLNEFTAIKEEPILSARSFRLQQNYPNPFNGQTAIEFYLPKRERVRITIFNLLGEKIRTLAEATFTAGNHRVIWDGRNNQSSMVPSGIYFCRMKAGTFTANIKMLFVR